MEWLGYSSFLLIGIILGLIGGGGSILGVPILVYLFLLDPLVATAYSLFIIGLSSAIGAVSYFKSGNVDFNAVVLFGIPSMLSIFLVRKFLIPALPEIIFQSDDVVITRRLLIMLVFSVLMLFTSWAMIRSPRGAEEGTKEEGGMHQWAEIPIMVLTGISIGFLSGFVGAGGGFMIIPALVFFCKLGMKRAIGTSLTVIAINSMVGFSGNIGTMEMDWAFLWKLTGLAVIGILVGHGIGRYMEGNKLRPMFGYFTLLVGSVVLIIELTLKK